MNPSLGSLDIDLPKLLETRLLIQASSGGGKSWALRRLLEQTAKQVQQIVIDPEGEFSTLREKFDYIICAPYGADAVATPATAAGLARALWESRTSAVVDLYELSAPDRLAFVRQFCDALIRAPKSIWHPALIVIDEAHIFAPQTGDSVSGKAVADLATRGRKRGLCLVTATQRLSKLHKDVAAELGNKLIGRTSLDIDVARAADELGLRKQDASSYLRGLDAGEFYAYGSAFMTQGGFFPGIMREKIGPVLTTHPTTGNRALSAPPPASKAVLETLSKLEGIQREAEAEAQDVESLRAEVKRLRATVVIADQTSLRDAVKAAREDERRETINLLWHAIDDDLSAILAARNRIFDAFGRVSADLYDSVALDTKPRKPLPSPRAQAVAADTKHANGNTAVSQMPKGERAILIALAQHQDGCTREQLSILTGFKRSTRDAYLQRLTGRGYAILSGGLWSATYEGTEALGEYERLPTGAALRAHWLQKLPEGEARILGMISSNGNRESVSREFITITTKFKRSTRDAYIQRLAARKLVNVLPGGLVAPAASLFD